jgi:hypothetical protein
MSFASLPIVVALLESERSAEMLGSVISAAPFRERAATWKLDAELCVVFHLSARSIFPPDVTGTKRCENRAQLPRAKAERIPASELHSKSELARARAKLLQRGRKAGR